jgi:large subunit ribosomal protein L25
MKSITIKGSKRESVGKAASKALRNAGKVPCVVYGGEAPIHFSADELAFNKLVYTPNIYTVDIKLDDGTEIESIMQDIQFHPVTDKILHIDFYVLRKGREITLDIPVRVQGDAIGVKNGGVFRFTLRKLSITSIPKNMPDFIMIDVSDLEIGDNVYLNDIEKEADFTFNHPEEAVVCQVIAPRAEIIDEPVVEEAEGEEGGEDAPAPEGGEDAPAEAEGGESQEAPAEE